MLQKNGLYGLGYASDQLIVKIRNKNGIFWTAPLPSPAKWGRGHERQSDCTLCNSTEFAPVSYLSSDVLLQLHPGRKSCLPLISLHSCISLVSWHTLSLSLLWFHFAKTMLTSSACCVDNCYDAAENSHPAGWWCCWSELHLCQSIDLRRKQRSHVERKGLPATAAGYSGHLCALSSCLSMQLFWCLTFPHTLQMVAIKSWFKCNWIKLGQCSFTVLCCVGVD